MYQVKIDPEELARFIVLRMPIPNYETLAETRAAHLAQLEEARVLAHRMLSTLDDGAAEGTAFLKRKKGFEWCGKGHAPIFWDALNWKGCPVCFSGEALRLADALTGRISSSAGRWQCGEKNYGPPGNNDWAAIQKEAREYRKAGGLE